LIAIIDYGMGNLASVKNAFAKLGYDACISNRAEDILAADKVVLPGVGAFADAINNLRCEGMDAVIGEVIKKQTPLLGICLGLQLMFSRSEENGLNPGLGIIRGQVVKFKLPQAYKVPHMGWNQVRPSDSSQLFKGIKAGSYFYFVHSYYVVPEDEAYIAATSDYHRDFVCAVEWGNLFATQFHPEKSGEMGLRLLQNFAKL
jgi:glutamine amidotransferase